MHSNMIQEIKLSHLCLSSLFIVYTWQQEVLLKHLWHDIHACNVYMAITSWIDHKFIHYSIKIWHFMHLHLLITDSSSSRTMSAKFIHHFHNIGNSYFSRLCCHKSTYFSSYTWHYPTMSLIWCHSKFYELWSIDFHPCLSRVELDMVRPGT